MDTMASMTGMWSAYGSPGVSDVSKCDKASRRRLLKSVGTPMHSIMLPVGVHREQNVISCHV